MGLVITDAQLHIWSGVQPGFEPHRATPLGAEEALEWMTAAGVARAVLVPPTWATDGDALVIEAARNHPDRLAALSEFNPYLPESAAMIEGWDQAGLHGLRLVFWRELRGALHDGACDWLWPEAERRQIPIMTFAPGLLPDVGRVARAHPGLRLVIDHCGVPIGARDDEIDAPVAELLKLAAIPNISVKATELPLHVTAPYPFIRAHEPLHRLVDAFGPGRVFWGSDAARLAPRATYRQLVTMFTEELPWLLGHDLELVMGEALSGWLCWPPAEHPEAGHRDQAEGDPGRQG